MREQYLPQPTQAKWTAAPHINFGGGIRAGEAVGADLGLMAHVWGRLSEGPSTLCNSTPVTLVPRVG